MTFKLDELKVLPWGHNFSGKERIVDFTMDDVKRAINEKKFDKRNYQDDADSIYAGINEDPDKWFDSFKNYHIERIAYLVNSGEWEHPITVRQNLTLEDGQHRYFAAKYLNKTEMEGEFKV